MEHICNKDFEGKIWVVDFFFTSCPTICPVMTSHMVAVQDAFADHSIGITSFFPYYIPDFTQDLYYEIELVLKINQNGKCISEKFAHKYYDEIAVGIDFTACDLQAELSQKGLS